MAISKFYLKRDATTVSGTLVGTSATVSATTPTYIGAAGNLSESMTSVISTAAHTSLTLSVPGNLTVARSGLIARWYSDPVEAQTFSSQTITVSTAVSENNLDSNFQFTWVLAVWRPSTGTLVGRIWDQVSAAAEPASTGVTAVTLGTGGSSSSVTAQSGDVLVLEAWRASSVTAATNTRNNVVYFDGTTEGSTTSNAAYLQFTNAVLMAAQRPVAESMTVTDSVTFSTSGLVGTKKFYLRAADHTVPGTFPTTSVSVSAATPSKITTTNLSESLDTTIGTGQTSVTHTTLGQTAAQTGLISRFMSRPLAAQTFASQQLDLSVAVSESNNDSDFYVTFVLAVWRPSDGTVVGRIFDRTTRTTTEAATTQAVRPVSSAGSSTSVTAADGDVLILEVWRSSQAQLSTNVRNNVIYFDGTTEGSTSNTAAFLSFANTVFFKRADELRPVADTLTLSDALTGPGSLSRSISDSVSLAEDVDAVGASGNVSHAADISDGVSTSDGMSRALALVSAATDTLTASDGLSGPGSASRGVVDAVGVADAVAVTVDVTVAAADSVTVTDGLVGPGSSARAASDSVTVSDTVGATSSVNLSGEVADTITAGDSLAALVTVTRTVSDSVAAADAVTLLGSVSAAAPESVTVTDAVAALVAAARTVSDLVSLADELDRAAAVVAAAVDQVIFESAASGSGFGITRAAADTVAVTDLMAWTAPSTAGELVPVTSPSSAILVAVAAQPSAVAASASASSASGASAAESSTVGVTVSGSTSTAGTSAQATTTSESSTAATMTGA